MPLGLLLTHPPSMFLKQSYNNTTQTLQDNWLNVTTAVALANTQRPPTRPTCQQQQQHHHHHALSSVTHCSYIWQAKLYLPVDVRWLSIYYFFCFKRKVWNYVEIQRCPLFFSFLFFFPSNTDLAIVFFLTREIKLVIIYCHDVMMTMITYLLAVQGALLPACVCMKGALTVMTEWRRRRRMQMMKMISGVSVLLLQCWMFFFPFLVNERFMRNGCVCVCVCVCACLLLNTYLLESGKWIDVNLTACIWEKGRCVCVRGCKHVWLCGYCDS